jgi:hypothetical protein
MSATTMAWKSPEATSTSTTGTLANYPTKVTLFECNFCSTLLLKKSHCLSGKSKLLPRHPRRVMRPPTYSLYSRRPSKTSTSRSQLPAMNSSQAAERCDLVLNLSSDNADRKTLRARSRGLAGKRASWSCSIASWAKVH